MKTSHYRHFSRLKIVAVSWLVPIHTYLLRRIVTPNDEWEKNGGAFLLTPDL
jgi:hypothetical protein